MAGTNTSFDASAFRDAIHLAMEMGMPTNVSEQLTFRFSERSAFTHADPAGRPYDWTATPTADVAKRDVVVPAAVEFAKTVTEYGTGIGTFDTSVATLTLLDVDYAQIVGCDEVLINQVNYVIDPPGFMPLGLFDVTVWQCHVTARG